MAEIPKHVMQHAFTTGEVSPAILGRQDEERYASAAQIVENFMITPQGNLRSDTGTAYVATAGSGQVRLVPFVFSDAQSYVIELGATYARFYTNGGQIQVSGSPVQITTPYTVLELDAIQYTQSADYLYLVHPNHPPAAITRSSNTSWAYQVLAFTDGPYQSTNLNPAETITASAVTGSVTLTANFNAWVAGNVGAFVRLGEAVTTFYPQWTSGVCYQPGDIVTNAGQVYQYASANPIAAWLPSTFYGQNSGVTSNGNIYLITNSGGATTGTVAPTTAANQTISGVNYAFIEVMANVQDHAIGQWQNDVAYPQYYYVYWGQNCYVSIDAATSGNSPPSQMVGVTSDGGVEWLFIGTKSGTQAPIHISGIESDGNISWLYLDSGFGYAKITAYTSPTTVTATVISRLPNSVTGGTLTWSLGAWDSSNGYPGVVCFYEGRLCFAGSPGFPTTIWMSNTDDYYNFAPTNTGTNVLDTNSITITLASGTLNQIVWMFQLTRLIVGTVGSEWQIWQSNTSSGFSPSNVQAKQMSSFGSLPVKPSNLYQSLLYVHRSGNRVYEATYNYIYDLYTSADMNLFSEHILREGGGVLDTAVQLDPFSTMWLLRDDGQLVGLTYISDQKITAWHRHVYAGVVESIACIPYNGSDQLWLSIKYTINGQPVRYIQYLMPPFYPSGPQDKSAMWYVECGQSETVTTPTTTVTGLQYLQGQTVAIIVDGAVQPQQLVPSNGTLTLQVAAQNTIVVGLPYNSTASIMPLDFDGQKGPMQAQIQSVKRVRLRLENSIGYTIFAGTESVPLGNAVTESFRSTSGLMNVSPDFFTGDKATLLNGPQDNNGVYTVQQTQPYPLNILALISEVVGNET